MTIKVGDKLPEGKLMESTEFDSGTHCAMPPKGTWKFSEY